MGILFDQDTVTEFYENELKQDAKIELLIQQFKDKKISAEDAATYLDVPVKKFLDMVK